MLVVWVKNLESLRTISVKDTAEFGMRLYDCTVLFGDMLEKT